MIMIKKYAFLAIVLCALHGCKQSTSADDKTSSSNALQTTITQYLDSLYALGHINGFAVSIINKDTVLYQKGFGYADRVRKKPYTPSTVQNIASISKTLIGIALLRAQELEFLDLDDPISKHLDFDVVNPYFPEEHITIRQLANHTSSITDGSIYDEKSYIKLSSDEEIKGQNMFIDEAFNPSSDYMSLGSFFGETLDKEGSWYTDSVFLERVPGSYFEYSNIGAALAAHVIEVASGVDYRAFTQEHILDKLNMDQSGWSMDDVGRENHSILYATKDQRHPEYTLITYPDGGFISSVHDMSIYLSELINGYSGQGTLLSADSYKEYYRGTLSDTHFEERDPENVYNDEYDMGVFMGLSASPYIGHTGGDPGVSTFMFFHRETGIGKYLAINTDFSSQEGVDEFIAIWKTLEKYQDKF